MLNINNVRYSVDGKSFYFTATKKDSLSKKDCNGDEYIPNSLNKSEIKN
ncbi:hypothetical protein H9661_17480 [Clostridium sp. Sa3CVN1]|uniref:Uncharacterized protein n=1 Tax=Clostridium cibarium TaxID=2762247 RepID=A0ABR8PY93_9CLOT|nr:hypothetical protein [Clostridium cibarium]